VRLGAVTITLEWLSAGQSSFKVVSKSFKTFLSERDALGTSGTDALALEVFLLSRISLLFFLSLKLCGM